MIAFRRILIRRTFQLSGMCCAKKLLTRKDVRVVCCNNSAVSSSFNICCHISQRYSAVDGDHPLLLLMK